MDSTTPGSTQSLSKPRRWLLSLYLVPDCDIEGALESFRFLEAHGRDDAWICDYPGYDIYETGEQVDYYDPLETGKEQVDYYDPLETGEEQVLAAVRVIQCAWREVLEERQEEQREYEYNMGYPIDADAYSDLLCEEGYDDEDE